MNIGELFVTLGVKGKGLGTLKDVAKMVGNLPVDAAAAIAGMAGISLELGKMAQEAMATSVAFQAFSNQTGLSWQQLQRWQIVAEQANVSTESVASSVTTLERNLAEIRLGRGNIAPFQMLGIGVGPGTNAFAVLDQLRQKIRGLNPATATNMITQMGLSPEMMNVLRLSDRQFAEFGARIHGINDQQQQDFLKTKLAVTQLGQAFRYTMFGIVSDFAQAWEKASQFRDILKVLGVAAAAAAIYFFPLTSAMAALILVLDDLAVYFVGGHSLTGEGVKGLKKFFTDLGDQVRNMTWIQRLVFFESILSKIAITAEKLSSLASGNILPLLGDLAPAGMSIARKEWGALRDMFSGGGDRNMENHISINVHSDGPLDAPGWGDVAHMVRKSVENAHLQLNN